VWKRKAIPWENVICAFDNSRYMQIRNIYSKVFTRTQKRLEFKWVSTTKSYTNGFGVHWRIGQRQRCGTEICGKTGIIERSRRGIQIWGGSATIDKNATKCDGDQHDCTRGYRSEEMNNHHGHSNTFGQRYLHSEC
jgi:hypothetical protein